MEALPTDWYEGYFLALEPILELEGGGQGCCACALSEVVGLLKEEGDGLADFIVGDGYEIVQEVTHYSEGYLVGDLDAYTFGEGGHGGVDQHALLP